MNITPRKPTQPFDFGQAVTMPFRTGSGWKFPVKLSIWTTLIYVIAYVVMAVLFFAPIMALAMSASGLGEDGSGMRVQQMVWTVLPLYLLMIVFFTFVSAIIESALHRKLLRGEDSFMPFRIGRDEFRVWGAMLGVYGLGFLALFGGMLAFLLIAFVIGLISTTLAGIVAVLFYIAMYALWIFVSVRLAPAAALSIYNRKAHVIAAKEVTKHRFWSLFLCYFVVGLVGMIIYFILALVGALAIVGDLSVLTGSDPVATEAAMAARLSSPVTLVLGFIFFVIFMLFITMWYQIWSGIGSYAIKWWAIDDEVSPFD